jgi:hypothetical protein
MKIKLATKIVSAVIVALVSAIGYALDIGQITSIGSKWWPLIGFIVFIGLVAWIINDLYQQNNTLLDNKPKITVEPSLEASTLYLRIQNHGPEGLFKAQIELSSEDDPAVQVIGFYQGFWKFGNREESTILKGQEDAIKIAELWSSRSPGPMSQCVNFWYFSKSSNFATYIQSSPHFLGAIITNDDGSTHPLKKHLYILKVKISSSPELRDGYFEKQYTLNVDGWVPLPSFQ